MHHSERSTSVERCIRLTFVTAMAIAIGAQRAIGACPEFAPRVDYSVGAMEAMPVAIAVADFNGDGKLDIAAVNSGANAVGVILGNGDGTFGTPTSFGVATNPQAITVADFNRDGKLDLAVANYGSNNVSILLGNGAGGFSSPSNFNVANSPTSIATGDFNRNGTADLAVGNFGAGNVSILLGSGNGSFAAQSTYSAGGTPRAVAVADLNGDTKLDLAVANQGSQTVSLLLGSGSGGFGSPTSYDATASGDDSPYSVAIADMNGDGKPEIIAGTSGSLGIIYRSESLTVSHTLGANPRYAAVDDFNGDGALDVAAADPYGNLMTIGWGAGNGSFIATTEVVLYGAPSAIVTADFNRDGRPDIATTNSAMNNVSILLNTGVCAMNCATFDAPVSHLSSSGPKNPIVADFNRDGKLDIAVPNYAANTVSVLIANGSGSFAPAAGINTGVGPQAILAIDLDRDGDLDLAVLTAVSNTFGFYMANGDGTFAPLAGQNTYTYGISTPVSIVTGDFNNDGKPDYAIANQGGNNVCIYRGSVDSSITWSATYATGEAPASIVAGDFNRDGNTDLAVACNGSAQVSVLIGAANGTFTSAVNYTVGSSPVAIVAADFNQDGILDLADMSQAGTQVMIGTGTGTFGSPTDLDSSPLVAPSLSAGDFNADGKIDLVMPKSVSNTVAIRFGNGDGTFAAVTERSAGTDPHSIAVADINRDAKTDMVVTNYSAGTVSVILNSCPGPDLSITKTHSGNWTQGQTGAAYTLTVLNAGTQATSGTVTVVDTLPEGLTATALSGDGWSCAVETVTCTRTDALAAGTAYPPLTLTVNVNGNAPPEVTNRASVSGGGELNSLNDNATDVATVVQLADLVIQKTHASDFTQSQRGAVYTIVVSNDGLGTTTGTVTVTDTLPAALTASRMHGTGWTCALGTLTCTRSDPLASGGTYPPITLTVNVANDAPASAANTATVSGGGEAYTVNDTADDVTVIHPKASALACSEFGAAVQYAVGTAPRSIAAGDLNADGRLDLVVANESSHNLSVLLAQSNGTLSPAVSYAAATNPFSVVVADLNGDGKLDLAVSSRSGSVSILLGNGDGTFGSKTDYTAGASPAGLAVADFDRDGNLDLATANSGGVAVLPGNGNGTFESAATFAAGENSWAIAAVDFNGDGAVDLGVSNRSSGNVSILLGNGQGSFAPAVNVGVGVNPAGVISADLNGDGKSDLAVVNEASGTLSVLLGNGDGTFGAASTVDSGSAPYAVTAADFNSDGYTDLAVSASNSADASLFLGAGNGTFTSGGAIAGASGAAIIAADLNGDGKADLALSSASRGDVSVLSNTSVCVSNCATFEKTGELSAPPAPRTITAGDLDGDGDADLAVLGSSWTETHVSIFRGNGNGSVSAPVEYVAGPLPTAVSIADFNRDGKPDLAITVSNLAEVEILLGADDGSFATPVPFSVSGSNPTSVAVADFNRDARPDLAVASQSGPSGVVSILAGNGDGGFATAATIALAETPGRIRGSDLNADGRVDLVVSNVSSNSVLVLLATGATTFAPGVTYAVGDQPGPIVIADFNHDRKSDLAIANIASNSVSILLGVGDGTFGAASTIPLDGSPYDIAATDFDADGSIDLAVANYTTGKISVLFGNGNGSFGSPVMYATGAGTAALALTDLNGDGHPDLVVGNDANNLSVLMNRCPAPDLQLTKAHSGNFTQGQGGVTYTLAVSNVGEGTAHGPISVADVIPAGLTVTSISGTGWPCDLGTLTCTRSDDLAPSQSFPAITVVANIASDAASVLTNTATVSGAADMNHANDSSSDPATIIQVPDVTIAKTHSGSFTHGQRGATYAISVRNIGGMPTSGAITVTEALPFGLTMVSMSGIGWTCSTSSRACARDDSLASGATYPPITVTVDVNSNASPTTTNVATVAGGGDANPADNSASDPTAVVQVTMGSATNFIARATSTSQVTVSWDAVVGAAAYQLFRSSNHGPYVFVGSALFGTFVDTGVPAGTTYLYQVRAIDASNNIGPASTVDLATTIAFTNDPIVAGSTIIRAVDLTELRTAVNAVRGAAGLSPATWTNNITAGAVVRAIDVNELRSTLDAARSAIGVTAMQYTDPTLTVGTTISAAHIRELRTGVN